MENDPFNRVPDLPLVKPSAPSVAPDIGEQKFVPEFALERQSSSGDDTATSAQELHFNNGTLKIDIDANGIVMVTAANGRTIKINPADGGVVVDQGTTEAFIGIGGFGWTADNYANYISGDTNGLTILSSSGGTLNIPFSAVTKNMGIKTWAVCDSGTPKSAKVLASDPY